MLTRDKAETGNYQGAQFVSGQNDLRPQHNHDSLIKIATNQRMLGLVVRSRPLSSPLGEAFPETLLGYKEWKVSNWAPRYIPHLGAAAYLTLLCAFRLRPGVRRSP